MNFPGTFTSHGLRLRPYRETDVPRLTMGLNDPEVRRFQQGTPVEVTNERSRAWIAAAPTRFGTGSDRIVHAAADPRTDELQAGTLLIVNPARRSAELGFWVCPDVRGRGVATALARALTDLCFEQGISRLEMLIRPENEPSNRVAMAAGFRAEGNLREVIPGAGEERHDAVLWSRLPSDK